MGRLRLVLIVGVLAGFGLVGCRSMRTPAPVYPHGRDHIRAVYQHRELTATLPHRITVQSATAAAGRVLRFRGHVVTGTETTTHRGRVVARPAGGKLHHHTSVEARQTQGGTRLTIKIKPHGDEPGSRAILDDILRTLGM